MHIAPMWTPGEGLKSNYSGLFINLRIILQGVAMAVSWRITF